MSFNFSQDLLSQMTSNSQMPTQLMAPANSQMSTHMMAPTSYSQMSTQLATSSQDNTWCSGDSQSLLLPSQMNPLRNDQIVPAIVPQVLAAAEQVKKNKYTAPKWTDGLLKSKTDKKKTDEMMKSMSEDLKEVKNQLSQISQNQGIHRQNSEKFLLKSLGVCQIKYN